MRITAEYISDQRRLLVRLLGTENSPVQIGTYLIDGTPQIPAVQDVDVMDGSVVDDEVDLYFAGYYPMPESVKVTAPDATVMSSKVEDFVDLTGVLHHGPEILGIQADETIMPDEPLEHNIGESAALRPVEVVEKPYVPSFWAALNFEKSHPVSVGDGMVTPSLSYTGGGRGRALDSDHRQPNVNSAPWLSQSPLRLEGTFTNLMPQSSFFPTRQVVGLFDAVPIGWDVVPTDPDSLVRIDSAAGGISVPSMTLTYTPRPNGVPSNTPVTVVTPSVAANTWFQVIVAAGQNNDLGSLQMTTEDGAVTSPAYSLENPVVARFNVGTHAGRVKIKWTQKSDGQPQVLQLFGPISSSYGTAHSWVPPLGTSVADIVNITGIQPAGKWALNQGSIRIDSQVEDRSKPFSWAIMSGSQSLLQLSEGVLSSDFSADTVDLTAHLSTSQPGVYNIVWTNPTAFAVQSYVSGQLVSTPIVFSLSVPGSVLDAPLDVRLSAYSSNAGTAIVKLFKFSPT